MAQSSGDGHGGKHRNSGQKGKFDSPKRAKKVVLCFEVNRRDWKLIFFAYFNPRQFSFNYRYFGKKEKCEQKCILFRGFAKKKIFIN